MDEQAVIKEVLSGNKSAFSDIIRSYEKRLYAIIYRIVQNRIDAEDIMQDTFISAYRKLGEFRQESGLFTWLTVIAYNNARQYLRRKRLVQWLSLDAAVFSVEDKKQVNTIEQEEVKQRLENALMKLPLKLRTALTLSEVEGLPQDEIALIMGCPVGTVWSYISRAKTRLRELLKGIEI